MKDSQVYPLTFAGAAAGFKTIASVELFSYLHMLSVYLNSGNYRWRTS